MPLSDYYAGPSPRESEQSPTRCWRCGGRINANPRSPYACDCDREPVQTTDEACWVADEVMGGTRE